MFEFQNFERRFEVRASCSSSCELLGEQELLLFCGPWWVDVSPWPLCSVGVHLPVGREDQVRAAHREGQADL